MIKLRQGKSDEANRDLKKAAELDPGLKKRLDALVAPPAKP